MCAYATIDDCDEHEINERIPKVEIVDSASKGLLSVDAR